jgi:hypothetical protein
LQVYDCESVFREEDCIDVQAIGVQPVWHWLGVFGDEV